MAANFEVKFIVDRVSANYKIQITDTSTGFTLVKANTKITFPDGYVVENTDVSSPDISSAGGYVEKAIRFNVANKPVTGDYTINFTGFDASDNEYTSQKQFNFTWQEPSILIEDSSDTGVPVVKFKDITGWDQGNFTEVASTRQFEVDYPQTSALTGQSKTESQTNLGTALEIDMNNSGLYYEGVYSVALSIDITYSHTNGYLTVQYIKNTAQDISVKRIPSQTELLAKINTYKSTIDAYKTTNPAVYAKLAEEYDNVVALYSHAISRYRLGIGDGAQDSIDELLELIEDNVPHIYISTPISAFVINESDFGVNQIVTRLEEEIGIFDEDGNLVSIAKAFADEIFNVEATAFKAEASKLTTLLAQFGTYDPETNTFSFLGTASYFEQVKTYADADKASATALSNLFSQFGTYDPETDTFTFSSTANYFEEVKTYADNDKASAEALTTLTSQFGSYDPSTNTFTFDNTADYFDEVKTYADENSAAASKISSIGAAFGSFDGNTFNFSEAKITQELNTYTGLDFSNSQYFIDIEAEIDSKPIVFRQASEPETTYATGSLWYDTDDENKVYILDGDPKTWTLTDDSRIGATATHLTTLTAAFGSYDPQTGLTIDTTADYFAEVKSYADTESASATKIENLGAELVTFDSNGDVTGVVLSSSFESAINTFVSDTANSALASKVEDLRVDIEGQDGTGGITAQVTENQEVVAARPKIFRQDTEPSTTEPVNSLWFDTNDNNKAYVLLGDGGDPEVFTWTETRDQGLLADIQDKPFIFRQDEAPATTNPEGSLWYDTNDGNKLYVLVSEVWTTTQDADIATAQATADGKPKVFRQDDAPATTEPEFSIWYDTNDNNLTYVLLGDGLDPETFTWTETIDGRVTDLLAFAEAKYSLNVDANGVVTGLELYSASGPNTTTSTFKITADKFIVRESSTDFIPFTLDGSELKLDVPLNGVSGSFSGSLTAATGTFSGNVDGNIDGTSASTVKTNAADGATAKGVTDNLTSVVAITSSDIAIVNSGETKTFNDDGTPFYVDNAGQFSLGDKLSYDPTTNTLSITGAVTIESVSGLDKSDVGLGNVDNNSTETILSGDLTGSIDGTAVATVKSGAEDGASAKAETDKLTSIVSLTNSDIAIVNSGETKAYNDAGTPFYVDNTGQFSLGNKLSFDGSDLSVSGTITMSASSTIDGTAASTVKSGAADGANAKDTTDNLEAVITITNTKIYQGTGTFGNANTGFYLDDAGQFSLKDKLSFDGTTLSVDGEVTATSGSIGGVNLASNKLYVGTGTYNNSNTAFYLDDAGQFSLKDKLSWDGSTLSIDGEINSTSGSIGGWEINSSELKSPAVSNVNRLKFSPTAGFIVNDDNNNTALLINYGALTSLSSTTTGVTFADVSNAEVASWDETVTVGATLITIPGSNERKIYSSNYLTANFVNDPHGGAYSYEITVDAITGALATLTGTSTYLKTSMALHVEIATDTGFSNVIKDVQLWRSEVTGNGETITFPGITKEFSFSISDAVTDVYLRFYWERFYVAAYDDEIVFSPKTFNVSSADANDDLVFLSYNGTTELTNEGVQIINDPTTYFKVDRANFTSGNPYVDIGGDVKVDGNLTVTGSINIEGDVENSDVNVANLKERLGEIDGDITIGNSSSVDVTFPGDITTQGVLHGPSTFYIDPSPDDTAQPGGATTDTGTVVILGDLQVTGQTTTVDSTVVSIADLNITLASNASNASEANGAGITIDGADATLTYASATDDFTFNKTLNVSGDISVTNQISAKYLTLTNQELTLAPEAFSIWLDANDSGAPASLGDYESTYPMGIFVNGDGGVGGGTLGSGAVKVYHTGHFSGTNISNWQSAYTYSQVGHLELGGGTLTGTLRIDASGVPQLILDGGSDTTGDIVVPDGEILQVGHWNSSTSTYTDRFRIDTNGDVDIDGSVTADSFIGDGSGLTNVYAETLDGLNSTQFLRSDEDDSTSGTLDVLGGLFRVTGDAGNIAKMILSEGGGDDHVIMEYDGTGSGATNYFHIYSGLTGWAAKGDSLNIQPSTGRVAIGNTSFDEVLHVTGNVKATSFIGSLTGNASTATKWANARTITLGGDLTGNVSIDGSSNVTLSAQVVNDSHTHDGRYYTEGETDNIVAQSLGWVPAYNNANINTVQWNDTEQAVRLYSSSDSTIGMAYKAIRVKAGDKVRFTVMAKSSFASTSGFYVRLYQHNGDLPDGKTHVSNDAAYTYVQEDDSGDTGWYDNQPIGTSWVNIERLYTAPADGYVSLVILNWTGLGTGAIYVKQPDIQFEKVNQASTSDLASDAQTLDGIDSTQFLRSDVNDTATGMITINTTGGGVLRLQNNDTSNTQNQTIGSIVWNNQDASNTGPNNAAIIEAQAYGTSGAGANLLFKTVLATTEGEDATTGMTLFGNGDLTVVGDVTADSLIKDGGTQTQFLKADGSTTTLTVVTQANNTAISSGGLFYETSTGDLEFTPPNLDGVISETAIDAKFNGYLPTSGGSITGLLATDDVDVLGELYVSGIVGMGVQPSSDYKLNMQFNNTNANDDFHFAQRIDGNFSGADNTTADREQGGIYLDIDSSADGDASNEHRLYGVYSDVRFTGFSDIVNGGYFRAESNNSTEKTAQVAGVIGTGIHDSGANGGTANLFGVYGITQVEDNGDVDNADAGRFFNNVVSTRAVNVGNLRGVRAEVQIDSANAITYGDVMSVESIIDNNEGSVPTGTNTYLFKGEYQGTRYATNAWGLYVQGDKHYLEGYVGINKISPSYILHAYHATTNVVGQFESGDNQAWVSVKDSGYDTYGAMLGCDSANSQAIILADNSANKRLVIDNNGNVGIGTDSPGYQLETNGTIRSIGSGNSPGVGAGVELRYTGDGAGSILAYDRGAVSYLPIRVEGSSIDLREAGDSVLYIDGGNVGIGTTSPSEKLQIADGGINITGGTNNRNIYIDHSNFDFRATTTSGWAFGLRSATNDGSTIMSYVGGAFGNGPLSTDFQYNFYGGTGYNDAAIYIPASKNVGIGNTSPSYPLDVTGRARITDDLFLGHIIYHNGDTNTYMEMLGDRIRFYCGGVRMLDMIEGTNDRVIMPVDVSISRTETPAYALDVGGTIRATGDVIAYSDARVKENVKTIDNALDKVTKLRGVEYNKIGETEEKIGVIAQEIEKVLPQVVQEDAEGMKSVAYGNIVGVLIEAIKEQQKQIDELKSRLDGITN